MSDTALATQSADKPPAKLAPDNRPPTGRMKRALDMMVHDGMTDNQAAVEVGITIQAIRLAIQKRGVRKYLEQQRDVSRARVCARNIHRLAQIRDAGDNMPAVNAIKMLEQLDDEDAPGRRPQAPFQGLVVQIITAPAQSVNAPLPVAADSPLIEHED